MNAFEDTDDSVERKRIRDSRKICSRLVDLCAQRRQPPKSRTLPNGTATHLEQPPRRDATTDLRADPGLARGVDEQQRVRDAAQRLVRRVRERVRERGRDREQRGEVLRLRDDARARGHLPERLHGEQRGRGVCVFRGEGVDQPAGRGGAIGAGGTHRSV